MQTVYILHNEGNLKYGLTSIIARNQLFKFTPNIVSREP